MSDRVFYDAAGERRRACIICGTLLTGGRLDVCCSKTRCHREYNSLEEQSRKPLTCARDGCPNPPRPRSVYCKPACRWAQAQAALRQRERDALESSARRPSPRVSAGSDADEIAASIENWRALSFGEQHFRLDQARWARMIPKRGGSSKLRAARKRVTIKFDNDARYFDT